MGKKRQKSTQYNYKSGQTDLCTYVFYFDFKKCNRISFVTRQNKTFKIVKSISNFEITKTFRRSYAEFLITTILRGGLTKTLKRDNYARPHGKRTHITIFGRRVFKKRRRHLCRVCWSSPKDCHSQSHKGYIYYISKEFGLRAY